MGRSGVVLPTIITIMSNNINKQEPAMYVIIVNKECLSVRLLSLWGFNSTDLVVVLVTEIMEALPQR